MIEAGTAVPVELAANFPEPQAAGGVQDAFTVAGTFLDRSLLNTYEIITSWPED